MRTSPALHGFAPVVGQGKTPVQPPELPPPGGEGDLVTTMYGGVPYVDYPPGTSKLELLCWQNYQDLPMPKLFPSIQENQKMWQEIELDRMLDYTPVHEIHAKDLPDYHYWPAICNDITPPVKKDFLLPHEDRTDIPRFHKNGVPKTPPQEQIFYLPLMANGRFDWKKNAIVNSKNLTAYCSEDGWNARYLRYIYRPWLSGRSGSRLAGVALPLFFRHREKYYAERMARYLKGSYFSTGFIYLPFYCTVLAYAGSQCADYENHYWPGDGPWNPDVQFLSKNSRNKGSYHDFI